MKDPIMATLACGGSQTVSEHRDRVSATTFTLLSRSSRTYLGGSVEDGQ